MVYELLIYAVMLDSLIKFTYIHDNADRIKESANSETKVFVCVARLPKSNPNEPYQKTMDESLLHFYCTTNK
jgi:hypothetical protein